MIDFNKPMVAKLCSTCPDRKVELLKVYNDEGNDYAAILISSDYGQRLAALDQYGDAVVGESAYSAIRYTVRNAPKVDKYRRYFEIAYEVTVTDGEITAIELVK